jgi:LCP family protein required for cell wall assembly
MQRPFSAISSPAAAAPTWCRYPPDVQVPIPGHGDGKIGSAYSDGGSVLTIQTVEQLTNVRVDHFAMIDWAGFRVLTDALGGVTVKVPVTTSDPVSGVTWTAGAHLLDGTQALDYVMDRSGPGGAAACGQRQQAYLRGLSAGRIVFATAPYVVRPAARGRSVV